MLRKLIALSCLLALPAFAQDALPLLSVMDAVSAGIDLSIVSSNHTGALSPAATWTTSGANLGAADDDRRIVVCIMWRSAATAVTDLMTIGGITSTKLHSKQTSSGLAYFITEIHIATVPSGTTGDIAISFNQSANWANWIAYRLTGAAATANDTADHDGLSGTTINVGAGGVVIGSGASATTGPAATFTGLTEDYDVLSDVNSDVAAAGSHESPSGESGRAVRINMQSSTYDAAAFVAIDAE